MACERAYGAVAMRELPVLLLADVEVADVPAAYEAIGAARVHLVRVSVRVRVRL